MSTELKAGRHRYNKKVRKTAVQILSTLPMTAEQTLNILMKGETQ